MVLSTQADRGHDCPCVSWSNAKLRAATAVEKFLDPSLDEVDKLRYPRAVREMAEDIVKSLHAQCPSLLNEARRRETRTYWACPLAVWNDRDNPLCMKDALLLTPTEVRDHVLEKHGQPNHCPRCYCVFESATATDRHIVQRRCATQPERVVPGVTHDQAALLRSVPELSVPLDGQWRSIWAVLFAGLPPPTDGVIRGRGRNLCLIREVLTEEVYAFVPFYFFDLPAHRTRLFDGASSTTERDGMAFAPHADGRCVLEALCATVVSRMVVALWKERRELSWFWFPGG